jgi:hypothetical protein
MQSHVTTNLASLSPSPGHPNNTILSSRPDYFPGSRVLNSSVRHTPVRGPKLALFKLQHNVCQRRTYTVRNSAPSVLCQHLKVLSESLS